MSTFVSVIVPAYNCAAYVAEAVESALAQDHAAKEVVVVNDGSKDDTLAVLGRFGDRIRVIDQNNAGPPAARNAGLAAARGDYVAFLDADDVWLQGKLSAQVRHLDANSDVGTVFTGWHVWAPRADGRYERPAASGNKRVGDEVDAETSGWLYTQLLFDCALLTTTVMLRRSVIDRIGTFDLTLYNGDDYDYWLRASREGRITKLASIGALYRVVANSVSRVPREIDYEHEVVKRAIGRWGLTGPDGGSANAIAMTLRLESLELAHAYGHLKLGNPRIALSVYRSAISRHPGDLKLWVNAARAAAKSLLRGPAARAH